ncbi:MAG: hypothetical protein AMXMBFR13_44280 [Phycisphaerae bacterium]
MAPSVFSVLLLLAADKSPATSQPADQIQVEPIAVWEMRARISHPVLRSNKLTPGDLGPDKVGVNVIARMQGAPLRNVRSYRVRVDHSLIRRADELGIIASGPVDSPHFFTRAAVLDEEGQQIDKLSFSVMSGGFRFDTIKMDKAPDDTMTLKLELLIGEKTITVPFELEDIELS